MLDVVRAADVVEGDQQVCERGHREKDVQRLRLLQSAKVSLVHVEVMSGGAQVETQFETGFVGRVLQVGDGRVCAAGVPHCSIVVPCVC